MRKDFTSARLSKKLRRLEKQKRSETECVTEKA